MSCIDYVVAARRSPHFRSVWCFWGWAPLLSPDLGAEREYRVLGARGLGGATTRGASGTSAGAEWAWEPVTEDTKGDYNFFKVVVEMP